MLDIEELVEVGEKDNSITTAVDIDGRQLQNRLVIQPMEGFDATLDGNLTDLTLRRYERFALSGASIIWFEAVAVLFEARSNPNQLFLTKHNVSNFATMLKKIKSLCKYKYGYEPLIIMQATHSGRHSRPVDKPSPIIAHHNEYFESVKPLNEYTYVDDEYCKVIEQAYYDTTKLAMQAGFDGVDVKCCHGYLFNEFLSAYDRCDEYGGENIENRTRLYFNCIDTAKAALDKGKILTTRLNAYDGFAYPYGYGVNRLGGVEPDLTEAKWIINRLIEKGIQTINITVGNPYVNPSINRPYNGGDKQPMQSVATIATITSELQHMCDNVKFILSAPTYLQDKSIAYANAMISQGNCQLVGFGRMAFAYPEFYQDYLRAGIVDKSKCCITCGKCSELMRAGSATGCPIRDSEMYMPLYQKKVLKK